MNVNSIAALVAAIIIILCIILQRLVEKTLSAFVTSQLLQQNEAPHITLDDLWIPQTVFAVYKFRKYWSMFNFYQTFPISGFYKLSLTVLLRN